MLIKLKKRISIGNGRLNSNLNNEMMTKLRDGDLQSFAPLYSQFRKPILKYVKKHVRQHAVAEELTHDVFVKIYQFRKSYNPEYDASSWIWTIARNTIYDHMRRSRTCPLNLAEKTN